MSKLLRNVWHSVVAVLTTGLMLCCVPIFALLLILEKDGLVAKRRDIVPPRY